MRKRRRRRGKKKRGEQMDEVWMCILSAKKGVYFMPGLFLGSSIKVCGHQRRRGWRETGILPSTKTYMAGKECAVKSLKNLRFLSLMVNSYACGTQYFIFPLS